MLTLPVPASGEPLHTLQSLTNTTRLRHLLSYPNACPTQVSNWSPEGNAFSILLADNPLIEFVELPPAHSDLLYSNVLAGVIRGALEMVQMRVDCKFVKDALRGDNTTEIRVELKEVIAEQMDEQYFEGM